MFDNGNKRTGFEVVKTLMERNNVVTGVGDAEMRGVIRDVATGSLHEVEDIASRMRGF